MRTWLVVCVLCVGACAVPEPRAEIELRTSEATWAPLAGAQVSVIVGSTGSFEMRNRGGAPASVTFGVEEGPCGSPEIVYLASATSVQVNFFCQPSEIRMAFRIRIESDGVIGFISGWVVPAPVTGCSMRSVEGVPSTFPVTEVGMTSQRTFQIGVDDGSCLVSAVLAGSPSFQFFAAPDPRMLTQRVDSSSWLTVVVVFAPDHPDADEIGQLIFSTDSGAKKTYSLVGRAAARCPSMDAGCPVVGFGVYLSTASGLYALSGGQTQFKGDFKDLQGRSMLVSDIAVLPSGDLVAVSGDLYLVNPTNGLMRKLISLNERIVAADALPDGRLVLGGDRVVVLNLDDGGIEAVTPLGLSVSGDVAVGPSNEVFVTLGVDRGDDALAKIDLSTKQISILASLPVADVFGLVLQGESLVGFTNSGLQVVIDPIGPAIQSVNSLPGSWTGAALH